MGFRGREGDWWRGRGWSSGGRMGSRRGDGILRWLLLKGLGFWMSLLLLFGLKSVCIKIYNLFYDFSKIEILF